MTSIDGACRQDMRPCRCGRTLVSSETAIEFWIGGDGSEMERVRHGFVCTHCLAHTAMYASSDDAVEAWNRRDVKTAVKPSQSTNWLYQK